MHLNIYMHKMMPFSHVSVSSEQLPAVVPRYCQPWGVGAFSRGFTKTLARQCRAFSRALKIKKLKAPLFPGPGEAGDAIACNVYPFEPHNTGVYRGIPIFLILLQNINCGYSLEQPPRRGGSNVYPQSMV